MTWVFLTERRTLSWPNCADGRSAAPRMTFGSMNRRNSKGPRRPSCTRVVARGVPFSAKPSKENAASGRSKLSSHGPSAETPRTRMNPSCRNWATYRQSSSDCPFRTMERVRSALVDRSWRAERGRRVICSMCLGSPYKTRGRAETGQNRLETVGRLHRVY